jgi:spore germination protein GerM
MSRPTSRRSALTRGVATLLVVVAAGVGQAGCGIPSDDSARPIDRDALPPQLVSTATTAAPGPSSLNEKATLYLVSMIGDRQQLVSITVDIANVVNQNELPRLVIEHLIAQQPTTGGSASDQTNAIPSTVSVINLSINEGVLELDLSGLSSVELTRQRLAAAQIVFTATEMPGVRAVRFWIDGQPGAVPLDDQASTAGQAVSRTDYPSLQRAP